MWSLVTPQFGLQVSVTEALPLPVSAILLRHGEAKSERAKFQRLVPDNADAVLKPKLEYSQRAMPLLLSMVMQVYTRQPDSSIWCSSISKAVEVLYHDGRKPDVAYIRSGIYIVSFINQSIAVFRSLGRY